MLATAVFYDAFSTFNLHVGVVKEFFSQTVAHAEALALILAILVWIWDDELKRREEQKKRKDEQCVAKDRESRRQEEIQKELIDGIDRLHPQSVDETLEALEHVCEVWKQTKEEKWSHVRLRVLEMACETLIAYATDWKWLLSQIGQDLLNDSTATTRVRARRSLQALQEFYKITSFQDIGKQTQFSYLEKTIFTPDQVDVKDVLASFYKLWGCYSAHVRDLLVVSIKNLFATSPSWTTARIYYLCQQDRTFRSLLRNSHLNQLRADSELSNL